MSNPIDEAKRRAQLQQREQQLSQQEQQLTNKANELNKEIPQMEKRKTELEGKLKNAIEPDKMTEAQQQQFHSDRQEYDKLGSQIPSKKQELEQTNKNLKTLQTEDKSKLYADKLKHNGLEQQHGRYAVSPTPTGTKKGDLKREYNRIESQTHRMPKDQTANIPESKDVKDWNASNVAANKQPNSQHIEAAKKNGMENKDKPNQQQGKQQEQDNER